MTSKKALLIFYDDSSLSVVRSFDQIFGSDLACDYLQFKRYGAAPPVLSQRQMDLLLRGRSVAYQRSGVSVCDESLLGRYDFVVSAKFPIPVRRFFEHGLWRFNGSRPVFVALFPGLELTNGRGFELRRFYDIVCVPTRLDVERYRERARADLPAGQRVLHFHPGLSVAPPSGGTPDASRRDVVFFAQAVSPPGRAERRAIMDSLMQLARSAPQYRFKIKLRHRADENKNHTHIERFPYQSLVTEEEIPENFVFSEESFEQAVESAHLAITCTSTAGFEALARGVPTVFVLDELSAVDDDLVDGMRRLLVGANVATSLKSAASLLASEAALRAYWDGLRLEAIVPARDQVEALGALLATPPRLAAPPSSPVPRRGRRLAFVARSLFHEVVSSVRALLRRKSAG